MSTRTQGTQLYFIDPDDGSVIEVPCTTGITGVGATRAVFTAPACLDDLTGTTNKQPGELTPGALSFGLNLDSSVPAHLRINELLLSGDVVGFAIGWSDGTADPTTDSIPDFTFPSTRTWSSFEGFFSGVPVDFAVNSVVTTNVGVEMTTAPVIVAKSA